MKNKCFEKNCKKRPAFQAVVASRQTIVERRFEITLAPSKFCKSHAVELDQNKLVANPGVGLNHVFLKPL